LVDLAVPTTNEALADNVKYVKYEKIQYCVIWKTKEIPN
jgi:hypothetical protein